MWYLDDRRSDADGGRDDQGYYMCQACGSGTNPPLVLTTPFPKFNRRTQFGWRTVDTSYYRDWPEDEWSVNADRTRAYFDPPTEEEADQEDDGTDVDQDDDGADVDQEDDGADVDQEDDEDDVSHEDDDADVSHEDEHPADDSHEDEHPADDSHEDEHPADDNVEEEEESSALDEEMAPARKRRRLADLLETLNDNFTCLNDNFTCIIEEVRSLKKEVQMIKKEFKVQPPTATYAEATSGQKLESFFLTAGGAIVDIQRKVDQLTGS